MNLQKAEQAILNGVYAAVAWLIMDIGLLFKQHGTAMLSAVADRPEMAAGAVIVVVCIAGLVKKSRVAALVLFILFVVPVLLRLVQGRFPSTMMLIFFLVLLYFFLTAVLGTFRYHSLKASNPGGNPPE